MLFVFLLFDFLKYVWYRLIVSELSVSAPCVFVRSRAYPCVFVQGVFIGNNAVWTFSCVFVRSRAFSFLSFFRRSLQDTMN